MVSLGTDTFTALLIAEPRLALELSDTLLRKPCRLEDALGNESPLEKGSAGTASLLRTKTCATRHVAGSRRSFHFWTCMVVWLLVTFSRQTSDLLQEYLTYLSTISVFQIYTLI